LRLDAERFRAFMPLEILTSYTWPTDAYPIARLSVKVDDLAVRLGISVHAWNVDGLGPARGFGGRLPSGRGVLFEELEFAVRYHGAQGPTVYMDAAELGALGSDVLVSELLRVLNLTSLDIAAAAGLAAQQAAANLATRVATAKAPTKSNRPATNAKLLGGAERQRE
jgi:hypothetical protein